MLLSNSTSHWLDLLWSCSLVFTAITLIVLAILVLKRWRKEYDLPRLIQHRTQLSEIFHAALSLSVPLTEDDLPKLRRRDRALACDIALDILRAVRGHDAIQVVSVLEAWRIRPYIEKILHKGNRSKSVRALTLYAHFNDENSLQLLLIHAASQDIYVQLAALRGLAARNAIDHLPAILNCLLYSQQKNILMLADILQRFGEPAIPLLLELATSEAALEARIAAVKALATIGSLTIIEPLLILATSHEPLMRIEVLAACGKLGSPQAEMITLKLLRDNSAKVRAQAAQTAGMLMLYEALPMLTALLNDEAWWVRCCAAESLYQLGTSGIAILHSLQTHNELATQILSERNL